MENVACEFCEKEFSSKGNLKVHQKTAKYCLNLQGKTIKIYDCEYCLKTLTTQQNLQEHLLICKEKIKIESENMVEKLKKNIERLERKTEKLREEYEQKMEKQKREHKEELEKQKKEHKEELEKQKEEYERKLEKHEEKYEQRINRHESNIIAMKPGVNNNNKTVVINTNLPLTNEVIRQCANTFTIDNARNIGGITKHLTSSLEEHITCTDPSRNIFKYTNEKDEEIVDKDLEILLPQYLSAIKDKNNFLHKEMADYFKKNNVSYEVQTDYNILYTALNSIIEKNGHSSKFSEKCKQYMVRECKKQFLDKNKNKEKEITRKLTEEEIMMMVIDAGGSMDDFLYKVIGVYDMDDETDEQFERRRNLEDVFRRKKKEWREQNM